MSPASGEPLWTYDVKSDGEQTSFHGNMLFTEELVIIGTDSRVGHVYAFEQETGKLRWMRQAGGGVPTDIVRSEGNIYGITLEDTLLCLDLETGREIWRFGTAAGPSDRTSLDAAPLAVDDQIFFGGRDGTMYSFDAATGEPGWKTEIGDRVTTSILYHEESLYVGTQDGQLIRLDPNTGVVTVQLSTGRLRGTLVPVPKLESLIVYRAADSWDGDLIAADVSLKKIEWESLSPEGERWTVARPFVLGDWVLAGSRSGLLHAIDLDTGDIAWSYRIDPERNWPEADGLRAFGRHESTLFVGTIGGTLYAFEIPDSSTMRR